jgi:membrane dipeptidase
MDHFIYVLKLIGPDHVGVGADWDGGGGVRGMEDITGFPKITARLLAEGYTEEDLKKIWGGNLIRVLAEVEAYAAGQ